MINLVPQRFSDSQEVGRGITKQHVEKTEQKDEINMYLRSFHNILRLLDVLPSFPFAISETLHDY